MLRYRAVKGAFAHARSATGERGRAARDRGCSTRVVTHFEYRALRGLRKMASGNVWDATDDARLAMAWIGDVDPKMAQRYLRRRDERMERAAQAAGTKASGTAASAKVKPEQSEKSSRNRSRTVPNEEPPKKGGLEGQVITQLSQSQRSGLNRRPLDYESSALPLSYAGDCPIRPSEDDRPACPGTDSNRDALRHHPLKMACLPISPPGPLLLLLSAISNQLSEFSNRSEFAIAFTGSCPTRERRGSNPRPLE